ncbi:15231_t:CDS:10 [Acaulospora colombiana]|uniref:15231_t:CDS:1 n=1 Tax=Acaulospora colombiana TaxID=27376 RepID=A0ACA9L3J7_9GLOM|nr:15231_t:CDS:10 [Acaulospora colombiana]
MIAVGNIGGIIAAQVYQPKDYPDYRVGHIITASCLSLSLLLSVIFYVLLKRENRLKIEDPTKFLEGKSDREIMDMGDRNPTFIYKFAPSLDLVSTSLSSFSSIASSSFQDSRSSSFSSSYSEEFNSPFVPNSRSSDTEPKSKSGDVANVTTRVYSDRFIPARSSGMASEFQRRPSMTPEELNPSKRKREVLENERKKIEDLMTMPRDSERIIDTAPFQMLAFCHELKLKANALVIRYLSDDFYLNVVDWSCSNILSLGLENCVYLWNMETSKMTKLCDLGGFYSISSIKWLPQESQLVVSTAEGKVQLWDARKLMKIRDMGSHQSRVGSADRCIFHRDPRSPHDIFRVLTGHKSEICGLKWNHEGDQLASGGNSNELFIWEGNSCYPTRKLDGHRAAVRALSWSPHVRNLLVSGGGHRDRQIRFWNTLDARCLTSYNVKSQWSPNANEIVSTHGWWKNDIVVWQYPSMEKLAILKGHTFRVLYFALSPNGEDIVTGAGSDDSTLRFWKVFNTPARRKKEDAKSAFKLDGIIR